MSLSIVIPVYNAATTIQAAILSADALGDVEIICVDDNSQDASLYRINELCSQRANIVLFRHRNNRGVGASRNTGLAHASRKWVAFLDADDLIDEGANLEFIRRQLDYFNPELMMCMHRVSGHAQRPFDYGLPSGPLTRKDLVSLANAYLLNPRGDSIVSHCWGKIYRVDFLKNHGISFREDLPVYEDIDFFARCLGAARNAYFSQETLYRYTLNRGLSRSFATAPLGFRFALEQLALMVGRPSLIASANAVFLAKTLSLSRQLSMSRRTNLCRTLATQKNSLEIEPAGIRDPLLRLIIQKKWYRYSLSCSLLLMLTS